MLIFSSANKVYYAGYIYPYTFDPENAGVYGYYTDGPINLEVLLTVSTALLMRTFVEVLENTETGITMKCWDLNRSNKLFIPPLLN